VDQLRSVGLDASWQRTYNAGSNPISLRLRRADLAKAPVQELLAASFEILDAGASPFTERRPVTTVGPDGSERLDLVPEHGADD
jgi:hypothetical protein